MGGVAENTKRLMSNCGAGNPQAKCSAGVIEEKKGYSLCL